ncbi:MAG: hypothetical protein J7M05_03755, partial [Anaerolineae bacterium]|nr:hypothetical protein [Anaerolineae bacterium]
MTDSIRSALAEYRSLEGGQRFFAALGYPTEEPIPSRELEDLPQRARESLVSLHQLAQIKTEGDLFRIFHAELAHERARRSDIRRFLEAFYRHYPQGNNLFVFTLRGRFDELTFVSPERLPGRRDKDKMRLWLRILQVQREHPYRTDLEVLESIRRESDDPSQIWEQHRRAFSIQRVSERFYQDYRTVFQHIRELLAHTHPDHDPIWARDYAHQLLNRIMFLYFIARKGWLLGPEGSTDRNFMRHFWEAYREVLQEGRTRPNTFHSSWLRVLFFEAFNKRWQNRAEYYQTFPHWLIHAFSLAPYLNGGLYRQRPGLDDLLEEPLPDEPFTLLFEKWLDGTYPGLFERYNFTIVESGRFDEEVAVDPEMLGMVYERLVNVTFGEQGEEDQRGQAGIFYTPRTEIDLMCRLSLVDWLSNQLGAKYKDLLYQWVFAFSEEEK